MKKRHQFVCKKCGKLSSTTNTSVLKSRICYACRLKDVQYEKA